MKHEIVAALTELAAGPFLNLRRHALYRALGLPPEPWLAADILGALARILALLAPFVALPAPVLVACGVVLGWAVLVASVEVLVILCSGRRV